VFRRALALPDRDTFVRSRLPLASYVLRLRSFRDDFVARGPCRIKAQGGALSNPPLFKSADWRPPLLDVFAPQSAGSNAALKAGAARPCSCCAVIMRATEPMMKAAAINVRTVTVSPAKKVPSKTATIGFT